MTNFDRFAAACQSIGLRAVYQAHAHWQVVGGNFLVNYYPTTEVVHVQGMNRRHPEGGATAAIKAARRIPEIVPKNRRDPPLKACQIGSIKNNLLRRRRSCFWCACPLVWANASIEHIIPRERGGSGRGSDNLTLACVRCNTSHIGLKLMERPDYVFGKEMIDHAKALLERLYPAAPPAGGELHLPIRGAAAEEAGPAAAVAAASGDASGGGRDPDRAGDEPLRLASECFTLGFYREAAEDREKRSMQS